MAVSGVAVILQRFVVFHQHFTIFMGKEGADAETRLSRGVFR
jgi:hypothetical protein